jgi:hypothetical protein
MPVNTWAWVDYENGNTADKIPMPIIAAGDHTIRLIGNAAEPGVKVDRILLTRDTACIPSGNGDSCIGAISTPTPTPAAVSTVTPTFTPTPVSVPVTNTPTPTPAVTGPVITTGVLPRGTRNSPYMATVTATDGTPGDTIGLTASKLPPGLALGPCSLSSGFSGATATCPLAGTPTAKGNYSSVFTAIDGSGNRAGKTIKIQIQ